jgi:hypothetical protein
MQVKTLEQAQERLQQSINLNAQAIGSTGLKDMKKASPSAKLEEKLREKKRQRYQCYTIHE